METEKVPQNTATEIQKTGKPVKVKEAKRKFDWYNLIASLLMIAVGLGIVLSPGESSQWMAYIVAAAITLAGIVRIFVYYRRHEKTRPLSFGGLSVGLTLLSVGVLLLLEPGLTLLVLPVALGGLLIFTGFGSLQTALSLMKLKIPHWYIPLIFSILSIGCGFIALINPFGAAKILMLFLGFSICGEGVLLGITEILFRKNVETPNA